MTLREPDALHWRKSSFSAENGACVEVAWRKSSFSGGNGDCVEIAPVSTGVLVRDSKNAGGPTLAVPHAHWRTFLHTRAHHGRSA